MAVSAVAFVRVLEVRLGRHGNPAAGLEQLLLVVAGMLTVLTVLSCPTTFI